MCTEVGRGRTEISQTGSLDTTPNRAVTFASSKSVWRSGGTPLPFLTLVFNFHAPADLLYGKGPGTQWIGGWDRPHSQSGRCGGGNTLPVPGLKPRSSTRPYSNNILPSSVGLDHLSRFLTKG